MIILSSLWYNKMPPIIAFSNFRGSVFSYVNYGSFKISTFNILLLV